MTASASDAVEDPRERRRLLLAKHTSMTGMAAGIAHDFNNHAAAILGNNNLVSRAMGLDTRARECVARIDAAAQLALALSDQLATYAGRVIFDHQPLAPADLLNRVVAGTRRNLPAGITIEAGAVPPKGPWRGDARLLERALQCLVTNAVEALADRSGSVRLDAGPYRPEPEDADLAVFELAAAPGWWVLRVRDTGPGIAPEFRPRIFDPFFSTKIRGRGMGLPETLGIASIHGGNVILRSTPGAGTDVRLVLPPVPPED